MNRFAFVLFGIF